MNARVLHQSNWFSIRVDAEGGEFVASTGDEVLVVALTATDEVILSVEPSAAFGELVLILPGGQVEPEMTLAELANKECRKRSATGRIGWTTWASCGRGPSTWRSAAMFSWRAT